MGVATLAITDTMVFGLQQIASSLGTTADVLAEQAIRSYLRQEKDNSTKS
jgi:predicted transcriptional regulator